MAHKVSLFFTLFYSFFLLKSHNSSSFFANFEPVEFLIQFVWSLLPPYSLFLLRPFLCSFMFLTFFLFLSSSFFLHHFYLSPFLFSSFLFPSFLLFYLFLRSFTFSFHLLHSWCEVSSRQTKLFYFSLSSFLLFSNVFLLLYKVP